MRKMRIKDSTNTTPKQIRFSLTGLGILGFTFVLLTSIGYAALNTELTISGEASFVKEVVEGAPNPPYMTANMIAIKWDGASWVKADQKNPKSNPWYDYDKQMWANMALVTNTNREVYKSASVGTVIPEDDVLAYYVWIPRYRYKLFNTNNLAVPMQQIEVIFEKASTKSPGTVNGEYLTHPAFTFGGIELTGIWMGKFEPSADPSSSCNENPAIETCNTTSITPRIKPNADTWRFITLSNSFTVAQSFKNNPIYGMTADRVDSHIMKNMDWGSVAYLSQSKYGKYGNDNYVGTNKEVFMNNYQKDIITYKTFTGCSSGVTSAAVATTCAYTYDVDKSGTGASTTGTIYGIYDMSGGTWEFAMGNMVNSSGTFYSSTAGFASALASQYYNSYAYGNSTTQFSRGLLGDATRETIKGLAVNGGAWNNDHSTFPYLERPWFLRGGTSSDVALTGVFAFHNFGGATNYNISFRGVLVEN